MNLTPAAIVAAICCLVCSGVFFSVGAFVKKSNAPIHFWSGALTTKKQITDTRRYNRANAMIWFSFGIYMVLCGVLAILVGVGAAVIAAVVLCVLAFPALAIASKRIYLKLSSSPQDSSGE